MIKNYQYNYKLYAKVLFTFCLVVSVFAIYADGGSLNFNSLFFIVPITILPIIFVYIFGKYLSYMQVNYSTGEVRYYHFGFPQKFNVSDIKEISKNKLLNDTVIYGEFEGKKTMLAMSFIEFFNSSNNPFKKDHSGFNEFVEYVKKNNPSTVINL